MKKDPIRKIALFADVLEENFDGVSVTLHKILKNAPKDQFDFLVITPHPPRHPELIPYPIHVCKYIKLPFQKGYRLGIPSRDITRLLDDFTPDLIHFTSPSLLGKFAIKYGKKHRIPVMNIYHTHFPAYLKYYIGSIGDFLLGWLIKRLAMWHYKRADLTLTPTKPIRRDLLNLGVPNHKMKLWGRAIEVGSYSPSFRNPRLFDVVVPRERKKVLFVSRLIKEKDMPALVKIYKKLQKDAPDITMIITGDGPKKEWLEDRMRKAIFTGKKTGVDLAEIYASCDLFLFPSSSETFGNVVIEALASGLPVVCADAGGPSEIIRNNKNGFKISSGKSKDYVKRIKQICESQKLHKKLSTAAVKTIESRSIESLHERLWSIYRKTIRDYQKAQADRLEAEIATLRDESSGKAILGSVP